MLQTQEKTSKEEKLLKKIVEKLENLGYEDIKADVEGYEVPSKLIRQNDDIEFIPDITATLNGRKYYFEIARKTKEEVKLVGKWKLLMTLAEMKEGGFKVFVPHGQMKFTKELMKNHNIDFELEKI